jgi:pSer/pThr/pTyr-binding forkhead associated (FHA) protein
MAETMLTICSPRQTWHVRLNPQGTVLGRNPTCDVVIDSPDVSRRHAVIARTPSHQWVITDLGSSNGTFVNGERLETCVLTAADVVEIGPVSLLLGERLEQPAAAIPTPPHPKIVVEDFGTEVFYDRPRIAECTTPPYPQRLENVARRLSELTDPDAVYPEVCRALAQGPGTAAAILRVPPGDKPMPKSPRVVAYHFGSRGEDTSGGITRRGGDSISAILPGAQCG